MTISSETSRVTYTGAGTTGPFSVPFYFLADNDLTIIKTLISDGTETTLTLTTDYSISGTADPAGGTVTLVSALSASYKLTIVRDPDSLQETDYQAGDPFPAESHERALDKLTMLVQRALDKVNRAFRLSDGDVSGVGLTLSNLAANKVLVVNSAGDGIEGADAIDVNLTPVSAFIATLLDDVDAAAARATLGAGTGDGDALQASIQTQSYTKFTAGGTADAITGALAPVIVAYATGMRITTTPPGANTITAPTINLSTLGAKKVFKRDASGSAVALAAGDYNASGPFDFQYDAALDTAAGGWVLLNPLPASASGSPPVRQTVFSASVDASGLPNFMSGVGTTTLTVAGSAGTPFVATAANGFSTTGPVDRIGSSTSNLTLTGQSTNGTYYAYVDIASNGTMTLGASSLAPTYQAGGTYSTTNGQFTFNCLGEMVGKLGNGSTAAQAYRVYIGEFTVAANVIATVTPYALMGRYSSGLNALPGSGTALNMNHNIGATPMFARAVLQCQTGELGYAIGDEVPFEDITNSGSIVAASTATGRMTTTTTYFALTPYLIQKGSAASGAITTGNWKIKSYANRGW